MGVTDLKELSHSEYVALAEVRYQIRRFLHFSENAARDAGLEPQQHQALLAIHTAPSDGLTIGGVAERLMIRHHSAVGLVDRLERLGMVERVAGQADGRKVMVRLTSGGESALLRLSLAHRAELEQIAPDLVRALQSVIPAPAEPPRSPQRQYS